MAWTVPGFITPPEEESWDLKTDCKFCKRAEQRAKERIAQEILDKQLINEGLIEEEVEDKARLLVTERLAEEKLTQDRLIAALVGQGAAGQEGVSPKKQSQTEQTMYNNARFDDEFPRGGGRLPELDRGYQHNGFQEKDGTRYNVWKRPDVKVSDLPPLTRDNAGGGGEDSPQEEDGDCGDFLKSNWYFFLFFFLSIGALAASIVLYLRCDIPVQRDPVDYTIRNITYSYENISLPFNSVSFPTPKTTKRTTAKPTTTSPSTTVAEEITTNRGIARRPPGGFYFPAKLKEVAEAVVSSQEGDQPSEVPLPDAEAAEASEDEEADEGEEAGEAKKRSKRQNAGKQKSGGTDADYSVGCVIPLVGIVVSTVVLILITFYLLYGVAKLVQDYF